MGHSNVKIGCEAYIVRNNQLLLGKRGKVDGQGTWALPGGHLEFMERADQSLVRELKEELGVEVQPVNMELLAVTDDLRPELNEHYVHVTYRVDIGSQRPQRTEPDKCQEWRWFSLEQLPSEIYPHQLKIFQTINTGRIYKSEPSTSNNAPTATGHER